jgi:hypothetical protein
MYCRPNWLDAPNIVLRIGVRATMGTTAIAATSGASIPSMGRKLAASPAATIATMLPTTRPMSAFVAVMSMSSRMISPRAANSSPIANGLGSALGAICSTSTMSTQSTSMMRPTAMGAMMRSAVSLATEVIARSPSRSEFRAAPRARR